MLLEGVLAATGPARTVLEMTLARVGGDGLPGPAVTRAPSVSGHAGETGATSGPLSPAPAALPPYLPEEPPGSLAGPRAGPGAHGGRLSPREASPGHPTGNRPVSLWPQPQTGAGVGARPVTHTTARVTPGPTAHLCRRPCSGSLAEELSPCPSSPAPPQAGWEGKSRCLLWGTGGAV
ncbi:Hypothetical predicted protein [Lynx pardinus]|uniref:Uncharacterized protein n=1 Tax=Lynx pardinus TaxID=191816 RepID=A0A485MTD7_LYNPA|nr:Hypothetical predicted protein [Lynx pardinus]